MLIIHHLEPSASFQSLTLSDTHLSFSILLPCVILLKNHTVSSCSAPHGQSIKNKNSLLKCQYFIFILFFFCTGAGQIFHQLLCFIVFSSWYSFSTADIVGRRWHDTRETWRENNGTNKHRLSFYFYRVFQLAVCSKTVHVTSTLYSTLHTNAE